MPRRYWAFTDLKFEYSGYNVPEIYKAAWQALLERKYFITERKFIWIWVGDTYGVAAWWTATYESEKKYSLTAIDLYLKIVWKMVTKPGAKGENAPKIPYGTAILNMHGYVITDYLNIWGESPILSPLLDLRERFFYKRRIDVLKKKVRQDGEGIIQDLNELISFLPRLM